MMWKEIILAVVPSAITLIGVLLANRSTANLTLYRIDRLEEKVNKHNNLIERTYKVEAQVSDLQTDVKILKDK